ncbi:MAG: ParB/RepB/Spo0J family partition protein [Defluviitaleaceae bacterium]|nr:ParB/RepB/Spo0J family partition protein [Defluviitaleaceae bacterium]MCL2273793.1 ParB/RepB/Spo0J family partition protein [Defluviitaleaceae bacterium]
MNMKKGLGRGLNALLDNQDTTKPAEAPQAGVTMVDIRQLEPNAGQPRKHFDEAALEELAQSMKTYGIIQPLLVKESGGFYTIIAGERRYRAARLAQLTEVPVVIKEYTAMDELQVALIENIQRQDLTPIEEAQCYQRLMDEFFFSAEDIARQVGKSKHAIAGSLQLLKLSPAAQVFAVTGELTASHAKVLLAIEDPKTQANLAERIADEGLSVRGTETAVAAALRAAEETSTSTVPESVLQAYRTAEIDLKHALGAKVSIRPGKKKGRIEIEYYSPNELERLLQLLRGIQ